MDWNGLIIFFNIIDHSMWLQGIVENFISLCPFESYENRHVIAVNENVV